MIVEPVSDRRRTLAAWSAVPLTGTAIWAGRAVLESWPPSPEGLIASSTTAPHGDGGFSMLAPLVAARAPGWVLAVFLAGGLVLFTAALARAVFPRRTDPWDTHLMWVGTLGLAAAGAATIASITWPLAAPPVAFVTGLDAPATVVEVGDVVGSWEVTSVEPVPIGPVGLNDDRVQGAAIVSFAPVAPTA